MVRTMLLLMGLSLLTLQGEAQNRQYIKKGLMRAQSTFTPGVMLQQNVQNLYLHADLEYYIEKRVSVRSDSYIHIVTLNGDKFLKHYYNTFFGAAYHMPVNNVDFLISLQPGLGIAQSGKTFQNDVGEVEPKLQFFPMIGVGTGVNFFIHKNFHFLAHAKYVKGTYKGGPEPVKLDEFLFSVGLGWNVQVVR